MPSLVSTMAAFATLIAVASAADSAAHPLDEQLLRSIPQIGPGLFRANYTTLTLADGAVRGTVVTRGKGSSGQHAVRRFLGVPYAQPPVGVLRWQPPRQSAAWTGTRAAWTVSSLIAAAAAEHARAAQSAADTSIPP